MPRGGIERTLNGNGFSVESCSKLGRLKKRMTWRAASTGSSPAKGTCFSNSWYMIMPKEYTSTCRCQRVAKVLLLLL